MRIREHHIRPAEGAPLERPQRVPDLDAVRTDDRAQVPPRHAHPLGHQRQVRVRPDHYPRPPAPGRPHGHRAHLQLASLVAREHKLASRERLAVQLVRIIQAEQLVAEVVAPGKIGQHCGNLSAHTLHPAWGVQLGE